MYKIYKGKVNTVISIVSGVSIFLIIFYIVLDLNSFNTMKNSVNVMLEHLDAKNKFEEVILSYNELKSDISNYNLKHNVKIDDDNFNIYLRTLKYMYMFSKGEDCLYKDYFNDFSKLKSNIIMLNNSINNFQEIAEKQNSNNEEISMIKKDIYAYFSEIDLCLKKIAEINLQLTQDETKTIAQQLNYNKKIRFILLIFGFLLIFSLFIIKNTLKSKLAKLKNILINPQDHINEKDIYSYNDEFSSMIDIYIQMHKQNTKSLNEINYLKNYLLSIIDSMPSAIIAMDDKLIVNQWNKIASSMTGYSPDRAKDKSIFELIPYLKNYEREIKAVYSNDKTFKLTFFTDTNEEFLFEKTKSVWNIIAFPLSSYGIKGIVLRIDDVSEIDKKEQMLRQVQKMEMVGTLAGGLSHDFNNILGAIIATLSILYYKIKKSKDSLNPQAISCIDNDFMSQQIELLMELSEKAADLVKQLLTLSRKNEISLTPLDLNLSLKRVVKICKNTFDKSIEFDLNYYPESCNTLGDLFQIEQVLLNLFINASHAMTIMKLAKNDKAIKNSIGGILKISIKPQIYSTEQYEAFLNQKSDVNTYSTFESIHKEKTENVNYWKISVSDTGVGIEKENLTKIFEPFFTTKKQNSGTGLGLSMVYNIVHKHNGFIEVESTPEKGTSFSLYFPVYQNSEKVSDIVRFEDVQNDFKDSNEEKLILIVEDDPVLKDIIKNILTECGFKTIEASDGQEGIDLIRKYKNTISLIIVDLIMPKKSGLDIVKFSKVEYPEIKVILTSGFSNDKRLSVAQDFGVDIYLAKPFTMQKLLSEVKKTLK